ncbi:MAG: DNA mismatch repair endonuclease MutL, partial [bacterium]
MTERNEETTGTIEVLPESVARKIAAGEVIERPASVVRELLDNSLDAGATSISVDLSDGGLTAIRVNDNGYGMSGEDVLRCSRAHATSKVRTVEDLNHIESLGFRGEALSSVAAVSRLEIASRTAEGSGGRIVVEENEVISGHGRPRGHTGTSVEVRRLFHNFPARKRFLKRAATEAGMCRQVVIEKALAYPGIEFKLSQDNTVKLMLPPDSQTGRIAASHPDFDTSLFEEIIFEGAAANVRAYVGDPALARRDRRFIQSFVNGRRIREFSFVQAVEYALGDLYHGGTYPVCFIFVDVDPARVDFNVHPAKREAKFEQREGIHHDIVTALRDRSLRPYSKGEFPSVSNVQSLLDTSDDSGAPAFSGGTATRNTDFGSREAAGTRAPSPSSAGKATYDAFRAAERPLPAKPAAERYRDIGQRASRHGENASRDSSRLPADQAGVDEHDAEREESAFGTPGGKSRLTYHGQAFGVFLIVETQAALYLIDQHAAHERIMYDTFRTRGTVQPLLVPVDFEVEAGEAESLRERIAAAGEIGIHVTDEGGDRFRIHAVPESFHGSEQLLIESLRDLEVISGEFERDMYATMACKAAVRGGDHVDDLTASELARRTLALPEPRCPHGRPLWYEIRRDE